MKSHFFNNLVLDSSHEFLDAILKKGEYIIRLQLSVETGAIFEFMLDLQQLLQVLIDIESVVDAVEAELEI